MSMWQNWENGGLGDYIHYKKSNYAKYGIYRKFGSSESFNASAIQAYQDAKSIILKTRTSADVTKIEQFYTELFRQNTTGSSNALGTDDVIDFTKMEQSLNESVSKKLPEIGKSLDRTNLGVRGVGKLQHIQYSGLKDKNRTMIKRETLKSMLPQIQNSIKKLNMAFKRGQNKGLDQKSLNDLNYAIQELKQIEHYLDRMLQEMQSQGEFLKPFRQNSGGELNTLGKMLSKLDYLTKAYGIPTKEEIGTVAEYAVAAGAAVAGGMASRVTADLLESFVVGGKSHGSNTTVYISDFVGGQKVLDELNANVVGGNDAKWTLGEDGKTLISGHVSQDTVDVDITFNDANNIFGTDRLMASVKNYFDPSKIIGTHSGVSVISGVPFTSILNLVNSNFSNHYLNYLVGHGGGGAFEENVLKYAVAVRGLSGARHAAFNKLSQYFIVFSRSKKRVYVFSTCDLLEKISPAPGVFDDAIAKVVGLPGAGSISSANKFINDSSIVDENVRQRIANILIAAHKFKLSMSLQPALFAR